MKLLLSILVAILCIGNAYAQKFEDYFVNKSIRVDYIFAGNSSAQQIYLDELSALPQWAGRKTHLNEVPLKGNGQIIMKDIKTQQVIYKTSFSSLFQEWITTDEAKQIAKSFENSFVLPYPKDSVEVVALLFDSYGKETSKLKHIIDPKDILIHQKESAHIPYKYIIQNGDYSQCIDIAILAEGYTEKEMQQFYADAEIACQSLFEHEPFKSMKSKFNVVAVASPSTDSGVSIPKDRSWKKTAFSSHFDTFYSERYLTTSRVKQIHNALAGIPYEHIIVLANTKQYGGGGIFNAFTLTTAHHPLFRPVVVHEFGHSFGGLGDEYFYEDDVMNDTYPKSVEPWEPNITTLVNFSTKWKSLLNTSTPIPTPVDKKDKYRIGVYEGGGYSSKGIYRPAYDCRMRTNDCAEFCPACQDALRKLILFYTEK